MMAAPESLQIVCGACDSVVRVSAGRLSDAPRCPKCHNPLLGGKPLTLTTTNFDKHVTRNDLPVVVDFWAPWCGPCLAMAPFFEKVAGTLSLQFRFAKLDTEAQPAPAARFGIRSIPTIIVFRHGKESARQSGALDAGALTRWLSVLKDQQDIGREQ